MGAIALSSASVFLVACHRDEALVAAPMMSATITTPDDAGLDAADFPREPEPPQSACSTETDCVQEESSPLVLPAPFERCAPTLGKSPMRFFSARATTLQRKREGHVCCYVQFDCNRSGALR